MAGRIPELKDLEALLGECADVESAQNAFHEYRKRGGLNDGDEAGAALRKRVKALRGGSPAKALAETMEHYSKDGLAITGTGEGGVALSGNPPLQGLEAVGSATHPSSVPLAPQSTVANLLPRVTADEMREAAKAWDEMVKACVRKEDICQIDGHDYWRAQAWRRLGTAYQIEVRQLTKSSTSGFGDTKPTAEVNLRLTAPGGRFVDAIGLCNGSEKRFKKKDGSWMATSDSEHVIVALAWTRAYCRGMRTLVGFGEPSAEEVE